MKIGVIPKLPLPFLALAFEKILSFFSFSHHHQRFLLLSPKFISETKLSYLQLVMFLGFTLLIVVIFLGSSSNPSSKSVGVDSPSHSVSFLSSLEDSFSYGDEDTASGTLDEDYKDFVPRIVIEGKKSSSEEFYEVGSDEESYGFHGYDGYDEDNDDDGGEDDADSGEEEEVEEEEDLNSRIEEFIAKTNRKWKEEMLMDKMLYITPEEWEFSA